jgi:phosphoglycerol transferase
MDPNFFPVNTDARDRHTLNVYINSAKQPIRPKNRSFSTFDTFPSILDALGVDYDAPGLGLGRSLFKDTPTLLEKYGMDTLNTELNKESKLYNGLLKKKDRPSATLIA